MTLIFLGIINNAGYVTIQISLSDMANKFKKSEMVPVFLFFLILMSISIRLINIKLLINIRHKIKIIYATFTFIFGILLIFFAFQNNILVLAFIGTSIFGMSKAFGDVIIQGFIKGFPPSSFGGYSSGTGIASLVGSSYYIIMKYF